MVGGGSWFQPRCQIYPWWLWTEPEQQENDVSSVQDPAGGMAGEQQCWCCKHPLVCRGKFIKKWEENGQPRKLIKEMGDANDFWFQQIPASSKAGYKVKSTQLILASEEKRGEGRGLKQEPWKTT